MISRFTASVPGRFVTAFAVDDPDPGPPLTLRDPNGPPPIVHADVEFTLWSAEALDSQFF